MIPETVFNSKRVRYLLISAAFLVGLILFFLLRYTGGVERLIINFFLILVFFALFACLLLNRRLSGRIGSNPSEDYRGFCLMTGLSVGILVVSAFLPHYIAPFLLIAFLYTRGSSPEISMIACSVLAVLFVTNKNGSVWELACYIVLGLTGAILTPYYKENKRRPMVSFILFCIGVLIPTLFSYIPQGNLDIRVILLSVVVSLTTDLLFLILFDRMDMIVDNRRETEIRTILKEDYMLLSEIRSFSPSGFAHAKKVSLLAAKCAAQAGLDVAVSAAGGFYYRLGILSGEPVIANGVKLAQLNCFPQEVITILQEYHGQEKEISTPESALVHMIDSLVLTFEKEREKMKNSDWNREILVYQTLNEFSGKGMYDHSGLSINQYLKVREFLVRGEDLL